MSLIYMIFMTTGEGNVVVKRTAHKTGILHTPHDSLNIPCGEGGFSPDIMGGERKTTNLQELKRPLGGQMEKVNHGLSMMTWITWTREMTIIFVCHKGQFNYFVFVTNTILTLLVVSYCYKHSNSSVPVYYSKPHILCWPVSLSTK